MVKYVAFSILFLYTSDSNREADGHWWPETYYLGTIQAREVLYEVLGEAVERGDLSEAQAVGIVRRALFDNANKLYKLGLQPTLDIAVAAAREWSDRV